MSLTSDQQSSRAFKQLTYGVAETNTNRNGSEEPFPSGVLVKPENIYSDWALIPNTAPTLNDGESVGVVRKYIDLVLTAVSGTSNSFYHANLKDCIPFNTGDGSYNYIIKNSSNVRIPFGQGDWVLDTIAGVLTFYGTVPSGMPPKITFYKYIGNKGIGNGGGESLWETTDTGFVQPKDSKQIHQSVVENLTTDLGNKSDKNPVAILEAILNSNSLIRFWDTASNTEKKIYWDNFLKLIGSFVKNKTAVRWASKLVINGTYSNGVSGVGATLTMSSSWWQSMDYVGMTGNVQIGDTFLLWTCQNPIHNGIYKLTSGGYSQDSVFTRYELEDESSELYDGLAVFIKEGGSFAGCGFIQTTNDTVVIGSSNINFIQFSKSGVFSADEETITLNGMSFQLTNTYKNYINESFYPSTEKTALVDNDVLSGNDSENSNSKIRIKLSSIKTYLLSYFWGKNEELITAAGTKTQPTITRNGDGTINISSFTCYLFSTSDNSGACKLYTIAARTNVIISDDTYYYVIAMYNGGNPMSLLVTDNSIINHSDIINVYQLLYESSVNRFRKFSTGNYGVGLANKTAHRLIHTERFGYQSGLLMTVRYDSGFLANITQGVLWYDGHEITIPEMLNSNTPFTRYYYVSGVWSITYLSYLNNTLYNNGTTLATISNNKFAVTWIYAMCDNYNGASYSYLVGEGDYTLTEAQASIEPTKPQVIEKLGKLIYRVIIQKGATTVTEIKPYHTNAASGATATDKESVVGLRITDSPEFADVNITNLLQDSFLLNTAKSVLSVVNSLISFVSPFFFDSKNNSGVIVADSGKIKVIPTYSGGNITFPLSFVGANTSCKYKIQGKTRTITTGNIAAYTKTVAAVEGLYFFYIDNSTTSDASPVMQLTQTPWNIKGGHVLLFTGYFNATTNTITRIGFELHRPDRNIFWHFNEHLLGAISVLNANTLHYNGLASSSYATNNNDNFGRAMIGCTSVQFRDEELEINITHLDAAINATVANPSTDWNGNTSQFLGFNELATTGTTPTLIVFPTIHTLVAGQAVAVMIGNTTTIRGTTTITTGGTGTTFTVASVTGMQSGDMIVISARIPIYYISTFVNGVAIWRQLAATSFLAVANGAACDVTTIASGTMQYNDTVNGGFANMTANRYYSMFTVASNYTHQPLFVILSQGQSTSATLATSLTENFAQFDKLVGLSSLGIQEMVALHRYTFIYNTNAGFTNSKVRLVDDTPLNFRINSTGSVSVGGGATVVSHASITGKNSELDYQHIDSVTEKTTPVNEDKLAIWDSAVSKFVSITFQNFKSLFVNLSDINVSSWLNGEQRLLLAKNNNGVPKFDGAAELLDIFAPPANTTALLTDSGWNNEQKTITGDNTTGQLGKVGQILWLDNKTFCQVISATYTSNASVTYYRNRCFDNLDANSSTQDAVVLNNLDPSYTYPAMTPTGNSTDLGWDLATQTKILTVAARVGTWAVGGLSGEGYTYMCFKVSGSNTYWKRIGNPSFIQREITEASHPSLVAALRAYDWTLGKYTQSGLEVSYQDQTFSDDTKGYYYIKTDATKWSRFEVLSSPKKVTVTNAQLKALATTAVTVVAQPASEYANFVRGIVLSFKAGTEALTVDATTIFVVRYVGGQTIATITATAFVDSTTNKVRHTTQITISDSTSGVDNKAIEIINTGTQISGNASNNATLDVLINYTTVKL